MLSRRPNPQLLVLVADAAAGAVSLGRHGELTVLPAATVAGYSTAAQAAVRQEPDRRLIGTILTWFRSLFMSCCTQACQLAPTAATTTATATAVVVSQTGELPRVPSMPSRSLLMRKLVQLERLLRPQEQQPQQSMPATSKQQVSVSASTCSRSGCVCPESSNGQHAACFDSRLR